VGLQVRRDGPGREERDQPPLQGTRLVEEIPSRRGGQQGLEHRYVHIEHCLSDLSGLLAGETRCLGRWTSREGASPVAKRDGKVVCATCGRVSEAAAGPRKGGRHGMLKGNEVPYRDQNGASGAGCAALGTHRATDLGEARSDPRPQARRIRTTRAVRGVAASILLPRSHT